jgi:hypothetical protein
MTKLFSELSLLGAGVLAVAPLLAASAALVLYFVAAGSVP